MGLDIGSSSVKAVELSTSPKGFQIHHLGLAPLPPEAIVQGAFLNTSAIVDAIREAVQGAPTRTRHVAVAVSGHSVIIKRIQVPAMTSEALEESIRWEAEQYIPFDVNEVNLDFQILDTAGAEGQMDVLLVAAKKDLIHDYLQVVSEAGLTPAVVDVEAFAVENAYAIAHETGPRETVALVNIGAQVSNINVVSGGIPVFTRDVGLGGKHYTEEIQRTLSIGFEEAERIKIGETSAGEESQEVVPQEVERATTSVTQTLVGEIARSLDFYMATSGDAQVDRILLSGGGSQVSGLERAFQERTGLPTGLLNPLARMESNSRYDLAQLAPLAPSLSVGIGLALRRMDEA
jgi:type IV pilus assembly protein PilM